MVASVIGISREGVLAQDDSDGEILFTATLEAGQIPVAPAFVRLLRITLAEGASSPLHTHPGPELGLIEQGTLTVEVNGPSSVSTQPVEGTPTPAEVAPTGAEFELEAGDVITYLPQSPMTFRNGGSDPVSILSAVLLPAGNQHPPGVTYLNGQPAADAFEGVSPEILGDGVATVLPPGQSTITVERLQLGPEDPIPAFSESVMLSLESGVLDFTVVGGKVQVSRTATPGPQPDTAPDTDISLSRGDAVFFPLGMREVDRSGMDGDLVLLRMTISSAGDDAVPTPTESGIGEIRVLVTDIEETPSAETPAASPEAGGTPGAGEPTATAEGQPTEKGEGALVESNSEGVNVRSGPGTGFEVVFQVFIGDQMRITGEGEEADGFLWWPVELADDPSVTGYIADDFIDLVEE
jgi:quercetin dioxygenase-like cupin family protein